MRRERDRKQQGRLADAADVTTKREAPADTATSGVTAAWRTLVGTEAETGAEAGTETGTDAGAETGAEAGAFSGVAAVDVVDVVDMKAGRRALGGIEADGGASRVAGANSGHGGGHNVNSGAGGVGAEQAAGPRRAAGALESAVLGVLWSASEPLSPGEVREKLARGELADGGSTLSYSTVVTILTRLHEKRALSRQRDGRAYRYAPLADEAGLAARRLSQLLDRAADREAVLSRFVADLSERDEQVLRDLLGGRGDGAGSSGTA